MKPIAQPNRYHWAGATALAHHTYAREDAPQVALVPDTAHDCDQVAVVYNRGETPPEITVEETAGSVQTVLVNGVAVAVIARAFGPAVRPEDVLLVERHI
ncbi:MAG: hypothetical protein P1U53_09700 [Sulfitobacter sp.]|nr:hypothetical protein [Sulfitobacter sp.]